MSMPKQFPKKLTAIMSKKNNRKTISLAVNNIINSLC